MSASPRPCRASRALSPSATTAKLENSSPGECASSPAKGALALAVRALDPVMPLLKAVNVLSRRLLWPGFEPEPYLEVADLERAIELSTSDANLIEQEQAVLRNIVSLSETRADECMRPRMQFMVFRPPVRLADLGGRIAGTKKNWAFIAVQVPET